MIFLKVMQTPRVSRAHPRGYSGRGAAVHDAEAGSLGPVSTWTHDDALRWIASAEGGRFAHVVLPRGASGRTLLLLSAQRLSSLFAAEEAGARGEGEGPQWTISAAGEDHSATTKLGRALFTALRRHDCLR